MITSQVAQRPPSSNASGTKKGRTQCNKAAKMYARVEKEICLCQVHVVTDISDLDYPVVDVCVVMMMLGNRSVV